MITSYDELYRHRNCDIVLAYYGDIEDPHDIGIECESCGEVLYSQNSPEAESEDDVECEPLGASYEALKKHLVCSPDLRVVETAGAVRVDCNCGATLLQFRRK